MLGEAQKYTPSEVRGSQFGGGKKESHKDTERAELDSAEEQVSEILNGRFKFSDEPNTHSEQVQDLTRLYKVLLTADKEDMKAYKARRSVIEILLGIQGVFRKTTTQVPELGVKGILGAKRVIPKIEKDYQTGIKCSDDQTNRMVYDWLKSRLFEDARVQQELREYEKKHDVNPQS